MTFKNIYEIISELKRQKNEKINSLKTIEWLCKNMSIMNISVVFDNFDQNIQPDKHQVEILDNNIINHYSDNLLNGGNDIIQPDMNVYRVILSTNRYETYEPNQMLYCNGMVLDAKTWDILVFPVPAFSRVHRDVIESGLQTINKSNYFGIYSITQVSDGTVVNLYSWEHPKNGFIWCISTSHGYDVSHLSWIGTKTYAEIIYNIIKTKYPQFVEEYGMQLVKDYLCIGDCRLAFESLPRGNYTLGFHSHDFHPFTLDPEDVWLLDNHKNNTLTLKHIPCQNTYNRQDFDKYEKVGLKELEHSFEKSLKYAEYAVETNKIKQAKIIPTGVKNARECLFNYGYILKSSTKNSFGHYDQILIESPLLIQIKRLIYKYPSIQLRNSLTSINRIHYIACRAYLVQTDRELFIKLFPLMKNLFKKYKKLLDDITKNIMEINLQENLGVETEDTNNKDDIYKLSKIFLKYIKILHPNFSSNNVGANCKIVNFISNHRYAKKYAELIND